MTTLYNSRYDHFRRGRVSIETAETGRSKCQKCNRIIGKGEPRLVYDGYNYKYWCNACTLRELKREFEKLEKILSVSWRARIEAEPEVER